MVWFHPVLPRHTCIPASLLVLSPYMLVIAGSASLLMLLPRGVSVSPSDYSELAFEIPLNVP